MTSPPSTSKDHAQTSLLVDIAHDHTRPRTRKCLTRGPTDGGTPAGNECDLSQQFLVFPYCSSIGKTRTPLARLCAGERWTGTVSK